MFRCSVRGATTQIFRRYYTTAQPAAAKEGKAWRLGAATVMGATGAAAYYAAPRRETTRCDDTMTLAGTAAASAAVGAFAGWFFSRSKEPEGDFKVCVVGGAGGIGQPLSLLMASSPLVKELVIIDLNIAMVPAEGVAADLGHLENKCKVTHLALTVNEDKAIDKAGDVLKGCDLVLVPAGVPRKPGQDRKDLLNINCNIAKGTVEACAKHCPNAVLGLIVNPVNSVVPAMCELWKKKGLNPKKIVGITTLDCVRANKFVYEATGEKVEVPVIGGHAGETILPLLSHTSVPASSIEAMDKRIQDAGTEVVKAKNGKGSATLSMAYAGARLGKAVLKGLKGIPTTECAYVESSITELPYFASKVTFGKEGVQKVHPIGKLSAHEQKRMDKMLVQLKGEIDDGLEYARDPKNAF